MTGSVKYIFDQNKLLILVQRTTPDCCIAHMGTFDESMIDLFHLYYLVF